jgi:polysaccharide export outer membrane protein
MVMRTGVIQMIVMGLMLCIGACAPGPTGPLPPSDAALQHHDDPNYIIGPGDKLNIFVWRSPELSVTVPVRPDGKISVPLVNDIVAVGKTPTQLSHEIETALAKYVKEPRVTVITESFIGPFSEQVRVIGEAAQPRAVSYRANMTLLDVMIEVGGLTKFAAGDRAIIVRTVKGTQVSYPVKLDSLIKDGEVQYNAKMQPGDILIIPQSYF